MTLTDALLLLAFLLTGLAFGGVTLFLSASMEAILAKRHPEIWGPMQGYAVPAREARTRFFLTSRPYRLNDAELARAMTRYWIATGLWLIFIIAAFLTAAVRESARR